MKSLRIAVALHCFRQPLALSLNAAAETGAAGVQFDGRGELKPSALSDTGRRQLLHRLDELGLVVASLSFPIQTTLYEPDRLDARLEAIKAVMQLAYRLKARVVTLPIGPIPGEADSQDLSVLKGVLNDLARHGNSVGVVAAVRPARDPAETVAGLLGNVTEGPIGVDFDPAGFVLAGRDPAAAMRTLREYVQHVRIRDAVRDVDGSGLEVPLGRGEIHWDEMLALFDEAAYRGWLTVDRTGGDDPAGDVARAVRYLKQVAQG